MLPARADLIHSLQGAIEILLKRRYIMSKQILHRHELHIMFEEDEDHVVYWTVEPDEIIKQVEDFDTAHLTAQGAPLAATGIIELKELLCAEFIELALNRADNHRWRNLFRQINESDQLAEPEPEQPSLHLVH